MEVINDADGELVTFWRVIQNHLEEFLRYYRFAIVSRECFDLDNRKDPGTLTDVQRAVRYYYIQRSSFGGKTVGRTFGTSATQPHSLNLTTIEERLLEVHARLRRVVIEHLDACECIRRYDRPDTFYYLDPPYYETAGYAVPFGRDDYLRLRETLFKIKGRFLLSLNDHPEVRRIFSAFRIRTIHTLYSASNARSGCVDRSAPQREVLISPR